MQKCSYCGRENDDGSTRCVECCTPLTEGDAKVEPSQDMTGESARRAVGEELMRKGVIWFVGGVLVTLFSYAEAVRSPYGGHYFIAVGAIIYGLAQFFRGRAAARGTDGDAQAQELLDQAAHFESVDPAQAVALYTEIVRKFPGTRASDEAQRNVKVLTSHRQ